MIPRTPLKTKVQSRTVHVTLSVQNNPGLCTGAYLCIYTDGCLYKRRTGNWGYLRGGKLGLWGARNKHICMCLGSRHMCQPSKSNLKKKASKQASSGWRGEWSPAQALMSSVKKYSAISFLNKCFSLKATQQRLGGEPLYISLRTPRSSRSRDISAHMASFH